MSRASLKYTGRISGVNKQLKQRCVMKAETTSLGAHVEMSSCTTSRVNDDHMVYICSQGGPSSTVPRSKDISNALREAIVAAHHSGKGYKAISKQFGISPSTVRKIIYKWKTFKTVDNLPRSGRPSKFTPRSDRAMLRQIAKNPRTTSQTLQATVSMLNVKVHDSTIRKRLNKYGFVWKSGQEIASSPCKEQGNRA